MEYRKLSSSEIICLYGEGWYYPSVFKVSVNMKDMIVSEILKSAVKKSFERFSYYSKRFIKKDGEVYLEYNDSEVIVEDTASRGIIGGTAMNGHLVRVSYHDNYIYFEAFHGMCDGGGFNPFIKHTLYYYCKQIYDENISYSDYYTDNNSVTKQEICNPYEMLDLREYDKSISEKNILRKKNFSPYRLQEMNKRCIPIADNTGIIYEYHIKIGDKSLMRHIKENDGSPAVFFVLCMSRAIESVHNEASCSVRGGIVVNMRPALKACYSNKSLITTISLDYGDKIKRYSTDKQMTCSRGMVLAQSIDDNIKAHAIRQRNIANKILEYGSIEERRAMAKRLLKENDFCDTFQLSYVGKMDIGSVELYIEDIYTTINTKGVGMQIEVMTCNNEFCINIMQEFESDIYAKAYIQELNKEGINCCRYSTHKTWISTITNL